MPKTVSVSVPHDLTQDEARIRIERGVSDLLAAHGARLSEVTHSWNGNRMDFSLKAMGQSITGRIEVNPSDVRINADLPFMLAMLAGNFKSRVESEGRRLLEKK